MCIRDRCRAVLAGESDAELKRIAKFYDYLEVQPIGNNEFLVREGTIKDDDGLRALNRKIVALDVYKRQPVDSEHSAIFQCLQARQGNPVRRLILTASGGALRTWPAEAIRTATVRDVLAHPTWRMGGKITVDCATMLNKGLEVIEAHHLFAMPPEKIDVVVHPQSVIHSRIEFEDGAVRCV